jgi:bacillithiol biosynthesis deacetylase BshB1
MIYENIDFMVIAAHADDAELGMGGTIRKLVLRGKKGLIVDMTRATAATRGTPEQRIQEAQDAATILGVDRVNLGFEDASLSAENTILSDEIIRTIRKYKPKTLFTHAHDDGHPDHLATHHLVKKAWYNSGLKMLCREWPAYRPERLFYFMGAVLLEPQFCVDISETYDDKLASVLAYKSQFWQGNADNQEQFGKPSQISSPEFLDFVSARARHWGTSIRSQYAEAFMCREIPEIIDPTELSGRAY